MSKLDELIQEYCPDGVEYKKLGEIGKFYSGLSGKSKEDFKDGNKKFITYMNVFSNIAINTDIKEKVRIDDSERQNTVKYGDIIFTGSSETPNECGMSSVLTKQVNEDLFLNSFCFGYRFNNKNILLPDFSKYIFRTEFLRKQIIKTASGVTRFNVSKKKMENVIIPVPPIKVQEEIVHILDKFTDYTAELTAELTARKKQYEYYRDELLTFDVLPGGINGTKWKTLEESCYMKAGKSISSRLISVEQTITHPIKCYGGNGIRGFVKDANEYGSYPIIGRQGALCGNVNFTDGAFYATEHAIVVKSKGEYNSRFLYYLLINMNLNQYKSAGAQPGLSVARLNKLLAPVPPLETQKRIVHVLDNFEKICSDLNIGLPAEIAARQKQYEYYRDALLTFAAKGDTILTDRQTDRQTDRTPV